MTPTSSLSTGIHWLDIVILWAVVLTVLGGGAAVVKSHVLPFFHALSNFLSDWSGAPARAGVDERLGVMARLAEQDEQMARQEEQMALVRHELHPNGGDSLRDSVDRIESATEVAAMKATKAAEMAEQSAKVATATKTALDEHVGQSKRDKAAITARQDAQDQTIAEQKHTISNLAEALPVVARSTPPEETPNG